MNDADREREIERYSALMRDAWAAGNRAEARFHCRVMTGLIRGRSREMVEMMEQLKRRAS